MNLAKIIEDFVTGCFKKLECWWWDRHLWMNYFGPDGKRVLKCCRCGRIEK